MPTRRTKPTGMTLIELFRYRSARKTTRGGGSGPGGDLLLSLFAVAVFGFAAIGIVGAAWDRLFLPTGLDGLSRECRALDYRDQEAFCDCLVGALSSRVVAEGEITDLARNFHGGALQLFVAARPQLRARVEACY